MTALCQGQPVGIVGLGLIGGSLGLDLGAAGVEVRALVHHQATADRALERRLAAAVSTDPAVLTGCPLVVLALPLDLLIDPDPDLLAALPADAVLTDVGSVKGPVLTGWQRRLAAVGRTAQVGRFVAGHPMAGTARAGVEAGERNLFRSRPWVVTPDATTDPEALEAVRWLAETVDAHWVTCPAAHHDRAVALISHLPVMVSAALLQSTDRGAREGDTPELMHLVRVLASSGFADTTRVGGGNPDLGTMIARANRDALLKSLETYRQALGELEALLRQGDWEGLHNQLATCAQLRPEFQGAAGGADPTPGA